MEKLSIICLTPIKNESWILDRFLKGASLWADYIIIADQSSNDGSKEIALRYPKVTLLENHSKAYDEAGRQRLLIDAARRIPEQRLLIALDADEMLTANFLKSREWDTILHLNKGTVIKLKWANMRQDLRTYWTPQGDLPIGYMDDGSNHVGMKIHSPRIPIPYHAKNVTLHDIRVLHYQYTDWERMKSKQRWYQCWERLNNPHRNSIEIFRQYHHMDAITQDEIQLLPRNWLEGYLEAGIDMTSVRRDVSFWTDQEILEWLDQYETKDFRREAIWDVNWVHLASRMGRKTGLSRYRDPRSRFECFVHAWLKRTQAQSHRFSVRFCEKILKRMGW